MSVQAVEREVVRFLQQQEPVVLCLSGAWGVGKTHLWRRILRDTTPHLSAGHYAYVSLFGLNSLSEVKQAIFENAVRVADRTASPTMSGLRSFVNSVEGFGRKHSWVGNALSNKHFIDLSPAFFLSVRNQVVCFDDLERHGSGLAVGDVLGLASFLKEERGCRVALLLNDEQLGEGKLISIGILRK